MPTFAVRKANQVPAPDNTSNAVKEQRRVYDTFIGEIGGNVGELELGPGESVRRVKFGLTRAATRQGTTIQTWDANGKVYFQKDVHRGRPRKAKTA